MYNLFMVKSQQLIEQLNLKLDDALFEENAQMLAEAYEDPKEAKENFMKDQKHRDQLEQMVLEVQAIDEVFFPQGLEYPGDFVSSPIMECSVFLLVWFGTCPLISVYWPNFTIINCSLGLMLSCGYKKRKFSENCTIRT